MRLVIFKDDDLPVWIGQGLEHDLCVQGESPDEVRRRMKLQIGYYHGAFGFEFTTPVRLEEVPAAPQEFFDMWDDLETPVIRDIIET